MPEPFTLVAMERASESVKEIWPSGSFFKCSLTSSSTRLCWLGAVGCLQRVQVALNALLDLLLALVDLAGGEVAVPRVDSLELAAIDGHQRPAEQLELSAQHHEAAA